jgi:hypothetical protein
VAPAQIRLNYLYERVDSTFEALYQEHWHSQAHLVNKIVWAVITPVWDDVCIPIFNSVTGDPPDSV